MRQKRESLLSFARHDDELPKTVRQYREKYKGVSVALDQVPEILDAVHQDLVQLTEGNRRRGRKADFTSETILRALIVMMVEGLAYRETVIRIAESEFLQDFIRTRKKVVMDHTFLNKAFKAIRPTTWKRVNELLAAHAVQEGCVQPNVIRTDTTVVECNIHWPTDSSLLWDTWRVASRLLRQARHLDPGLVPHRFHDRKIKRLHLFTTRYSASTCKKRQRLVKHSYQALIARVTWMVDMVGQFCEAASRSRSLAITALGLKLADYRRHGAIPGPSRRPSAHHRSDTHHRGVKSRWQHAFGGICAARGREELLLEKTAVRTRRISAWWCQKYFLELGLEKRGGEHHKQNCLVARRVLLRAGLNVGAAGGAAAFGPDVKAGDVVVAPHLERGLAAAVRVRCGSWCGEVCRALRGG